MFATAREAGVTRFLISASDLASSRYAAAVSSKESGVFASAGVHPHEAKEFPGLDPFEELCALPNVVAVGEVGLDYYYEHSPREAQKSVFREFLQLAARLHLPTIIHCRDAYEDCLPILRETLEPGQPFEVHSFTGTPEQARTVLDMGAYLSFNGMVTFRKADNIRAALAVVPLDRILLETDTPYLAPVPYRGKPNQPAYVVEVARKIAELRGLTVEDIAVATTENACRFFGLPCL
jgi:TatD DNase family protein